MILLNRRQRRERGDGVWRAEQLREDWSGIKAALLNGAEDAGKDFLGMRTASGAIAATDFTRDDRRPQRVFGAPVD